MARGKNGSRKPAELDASLPQKFDVADEIGVAQEAKGLPGPQELPPILGDIALVGYSADTGGKGFAFVLLADLTGEVINITDNGWLAAGSFRTGEGVLAITIPAGLPIGTVIRVSGLDGVVSVTTSTGVTITTFTESGDVNPSATGDQYIVFQGTLASPTAVLFAIDFADGNATYAADATNSNTSAVPSALTFGTTALAFGNDNGAYTGSLTGTRAQILTNIANAANWTTNDTFVQTYPGTFTVTTTDLPPTLTATAVSPQFIEDGAAVDLFSGVTASTVEGGQTFTAMTLTVSGVFNGASEQLSFDGSMIALTNGNAVTTATNGLLVTVSVASNVATVSFTGGSLSAAALQNLIDALAYTNSSQNPIIADRVVTITYLRDSGSSTLPSDNDSTPNIASTVSVTGVNDAPVATNLIGDTATFNPGGGPVHLDSGTAFTLSNPDTNFHNFLVITIDNPIGEDALGIDTTGLVTLSGGDVLVSGVPIGTLASSQTSITITFTPGQSIAAIQALMQAITYTSFGAQPTAGTRTVNWVLQDTGGGLNGGNPDLIFNTFVNVVSSTGTAGSLSISNADPALVLEGDSGSTAVTFTVTRGGGSTGAVGATWSLFLIGGPGYAVADDFIATTGTVSFADGQTTATITVLVHGDFDYEDVEDFTIVLSAPTGGVGIDGAAGTGSIFSEDLAIEGTPGDDGPPTFIGTQDDDLIYGYDGDDVVQALNGNDRVYGGNGIDQLIGGQGNDILYGEADQDILDGGIDNDTLVGGDYHDRLIGGLGADHLEAGDGDDYLSGGTSTQGGVGDDYLDGGDGNDRVGYFTYVGGAGVTVSLFAQGGAQNTGSQGLDTLNGIENVSGTSFADTLTGDHNANWLWGAQSNFRVNPTTLVTSTTNDDTIFGAGGDDIIWVGVGNHLLDGGSQIDTLRFTENFTIAEAGLTLSLLLQGSAQVTGNGTWTISNFENLVGGQGNDTLTGDGDANMLIGERGDDNIVGGGGADTLSGDLVYEIDSHGLGYSGVAALMLATDTSGVAQFSGDDVIDGGAGEDTVVYYFAAGPEHLSVQYTANPNVFSLLRNDFVNPMEEIAQITYNSLTGTITVTGVNSGAHIGTDTLTNVEAIRFAIEGGNETIFDVNFPPVIANLDGDAATYAAGDAYSFFDVSGDALVSDLDSDFAGSALVVDITGGEVNGEDRISLVGGGSITFGNSVSGGTELLFNGVLVGVYSGSGANGQQSMVTFNGNATATIVGAVLRAYAYVNFNPNPTTGTRTVEFRLYDGDSGSTVVHSTMNVTAPVPTPEIDLDSSMGGPNFFTSYTENGTGTPIANGMTITNAHNGMILGAVIELTGATVGDLLTITMGLPPGITISSQTDTQIQLTGMASAAAYAALIGSITYRNTTEYPTEFLEDRTVTVQVFDDQALSNTATASIDVIGVNDLATITGPHTGSIAEEGGHVEGTVTTTDIDYQEDRVTPFTANGTYGGISVAANGFWSYDGNYNNFLRAGETVTDTFTITSVDGTGTIDIVITIVGANDVPMVFSFGNTAARTEDGGNYTASGGGSMFDEDHDEGSWQTGTFATTYGSITITLDSMSSQVGYWDYTLANASAAVQGLRGGQVVTDTFFMTTFDGSNSIPILITITGVNDAATITGTNSGSVTEDIGLVASGTLVVNDVDNGENELIPQNALGGNGYGTFVVNANGSWTYTLNNALPAVQALDDGQTLTDSITVTSEDGTDTETITVTINGRDEGANTPPVIDYFDNVTFVEDNPGTPGLSPIRLDVDQNGTIVDDSANFDGGTLTLSITSGGIPAEDVLFVETFGAVTVSGSNILVSGTIIGTWAGGTGGNPFVVTFNANATPANVTVLMRALVYDNVSQEPTETPRTYALVITDGDGGTSNTGSGEIDVYATNDAPTGADRTVTVDEDGTFTFIAAHFNFGDIDGDAFIGVYITTNASSATRVFLNGVGLDGTDIFISRAQIDAGLLTYQANPNANGIPHSTFTFRVRDDGGTDNGAGAVPNTGVDSDQSPATMTINVTPENDAPAFVGLDGTPTFVENGAPVVIDANATVIDPELGPLDDYGGASLQVFRSMGADASDLFSFTGVNVIYAGSDAAGTIMSDASGTMQAIASATRVGGFLFIYFNLNATQADIDAVLRQLTYANSSDAPPASVELYFQFSDGNNGDEQGSGGPGSASGTVTVNITPVNDAPVNDVGNFLVFNEDAAFPLGGMSIGDPDGLPGDIYTVLFSVQHGTLFIRTNVAGGITAANIIGGGQGTNGIIITGTLAEINETLAASGGLSYTGDLNFNGTDSLRVSTWEGVPADPASFAAPLVSSALTNPTSLVTGDFNGDGKLDLVYIGDVSHQIGVNLGNGDGTFTAAANVIGGANPTEVRLLDIDGDNDLDIVSTDYAAGASSFGSVGVNLNNGSGGFGAYQVLASLQSPFDVSAADLNGDGRVDLVAGRRDYGIVSVLIASGPAGSFAAAVNYNSSVPNNTTGITLGDFNNDGRADIIAFNQTAKVGGGTGTVSLLLNNGDGTFGAAVDIFASGTIQPFDGQAWDLNNDGNLDLVFANYTLNDGLTVMLGNGNGTFGASTFYATAGDSVNLTIGDVNGDGIADLITGNGAAGSIGVFIGNGNGTFQTRVDLGIGAAYAETTALGDFDGDGDLDIALNRGSTTGQAVLLNTGTNLGDTDSRTLNVLPVNDAPSGTDATIAVDEDGIYTFNSANFGFSDPVEGDDFFAVFITTVPANGTLLLDGNAVGSGAVILVSEIDSGRLTYVPAPNQNGTAYASVTFQVIDSGGTANGGVDGDQSPNTLTIDVTAINDVPVISGIGSSPTYTEDGPHVAIFGNITTVLDPELGASGHYSGATLTVSRAGGANTDDRYDFVGGGIAYSGSMMFGSILSSIGGTHVIATGSRNGGTFTITFNGLATQADVNAVLQQLGYQNINVNPAGPITLNYSFSDGNTGAQGLGGLGIATGAIAINIANVNDAPSLDQGAVVTLNAVNEDAGFPTGAIGTLVSSLVDHAALPGGLDNVGDVDTGALLGIAITGVNSANGTLYYSINNGGSWLAVGTVSDGSALLLAANGTTRLYFQPAPNFNGTIADVLTFRAWDQSTGSNGATADASVNGGTTAFSIEVDTVSLTVNAVNDAPVLDNTRSPVLATVDEDPGAPVGAVGNLVSSLVDFASPAGQLDNVTDIDAGALTGIAVTGVNSANGTLYYSIDGGGSWTAAGAVSDASALLLAADGNTRLYFQPSPNFFGTITSAITFRAWDQSSGTNGGTANTIPNGGTTAFSATSDTADLTVNPVNDAPVLDASRSPTLTAVDEDPGVPNASTIGTSVSSLVDFTPPAGGLDNVTDVDNGAILGIAITAVNTAMGTLYFSVNGGLNWFAVPAVTEGSAFLLRETDRVFFRPAANFNGTIADAFTFRAWDQTSDAVTGFGNTTINGGTTAFSTATDTVSVTVNAVNDAPVLNVSRSPVLTTINEDPGAPSGAVGTLVSSLVDFATPAGQVDNVTDVDAGALLGIAITGIAAGGTLYYSLNGGADWTSLASASDASALLLAADANTRIYYQPGPNFNGSIADAITFRAWDQTTGTNGGTADASVNGGTTAFSANSDTVSLTVNAVNDAPVNSVPGTQTVDEDGSLTLSAAFGNRIQIADVDAGSGIVTVTLSVAHGILTVAVVGGVGYANNGTATVTISGTVADINNALTTALVYNPAANFNGTDTLTVTTSDNGNTGTPGALQDIDMVTININAINDAPVVAGDGTESATAIDEDSPGAGQTIQALFSGQYSDATDNQIPNGGASSPGQFSGVAVTANGSSAATGQWQYFSGGVWTDIGAVSDAAAKLFGDPFVTLFRFNPAANFNGTAPTLTVHLIDNSLGFGIVNGQVVNLSGMGATGGTTAYSTGTVVLSQTVNAVNDAPVHSLPGLQSMFEDGSLTLSTANGNAISVADVDATTLTVTLTASFGTMTIASTLGLTFSGGSDGTGDTVMTFSGTVAAINAALGAGLTYNPPANMHAVATITVATTDNGQTGSGPVGTDSDAFPISITPVNDAPEGTDNIVTGSEDDPLPFTAAHFGFSDPVEGHAFAGVVISSLPTNGTLTNNGGPVAVGDFISIANINAGLFIFTPDTDEFGTNYASFTFQVRDNGPSGGVNVNTDQSPNVMTINIEPDNLPPVVDLNGAGAGIDNTVTFIEDGASVSIGLNLTVSDPDEVTPGDMIESATVTLIDRVAGDSLTYPALPPGFTAVTTSDTGFIRVEIFGAGTSAQYAAILAGFTYSTDNQDPTFGGTDLTRTITVTVNDGLVNSATATTTVNITAIDDLPVAQPDAFTITESGTIAGGNLFANNGSGADTDPDGPPLTISAVNGSGGNVGTQITLASGALLTVNANGTFDYNPNGAFLRTPTGGSGASNTPAHDSFSYTLAGGNTVTVTITLTGLDTDDSLYGTAGVDLMFAGNGADYLDGLAGADQLHGEGGDDAYAVDDAGDQVFEAAGQGNDAVYTSVSYTLGAGQSVETLAAANNAAITALALVGNELANTLLGNNGANFLDGAGGSDIMAGFGGDDTYAIDSATDVVLEDPGAGNDTIFTTFNYQLGTGASIETLAARDNSALTALALVGNELVNTILGNNGANYIDGGAGADIMVGYSGDDAYVVDNAADAIFEDAGRGNDIVLTTTSYQLGAGQSLETLAAADNTLTISLALVGNELNNTILGNNGANFLEGGAGADIMAGYSGDDVYAVDNAGDQVFEDAGRGLDTVYTTVSYALAAGTSVEVLSARDASLTVPLNLTGNELANTILGNDGANVIDGKGGNDSLIGLDGADTFQFTTALGAGNVDLVFGFTHGVDKIALDDAVFTTAGPLGALNANAFVVGAAAADASERIIYNSLTGQLFYDADGNGAGAAVQFATLSPGLTLTASDFTVI